MSNEPDRIEGAIREQGPYGGKAPGESRVGTLADELELFATWRKQGEGSIMDFINSTPFNAAPFSHMDATGAESLVVVVKGTWTIREGKELVVAAEQTPIRHAPEYHGDPGSSSLRYDTDMVPEKPGTDCVLLGHAWAPEAGATQVHVTLAAGPVQKTIRVFGERIWIKCLGIVSMSRPAPFEKIPLVYERAFGGSDTSWPDPKHYEFCLENPVGKGFMGRRTKIEPDGMRLPNLESPTHPIRKPKDRPVPSGFGMIAPYWSPRAGYAGTCDEHWRRHVSPLPPEDLDTRFYSSASPGLASGKHFAGNEQVLVKGAHRYGRLIFDLPGITPRVTVRRMGGSDDLAMWLDTIIVEPDEERLTLVWRGRFSVNGKLRDILGTRIYI